MDCRHGGPIIARIATNDTFIRLAGSKLFCRVEKYLFLSYTFNAPIADADGAEREKLSMNI